MPGSSEASWIHLENSDPPPDRKVSSGTLVPPPVSSCHVPSQPTSPVSDLRVDQWIEVVQQLVQQVGQNAADPGETNDDGDVDDEEVVKEGLLHLKLEPVPSDAASFRTWKNGFKVQLSKLDTSGQGLVLAWISRGFDVDKADLQDSGPLPRLDAWVAVRTCPEAVLRA